MYVEKYTNMLDKTNINEDININTTLQSFEISYENYQENCALIESSGIILEDSNQVLTVLTEGFIGRFWDLIKKGIKWLINKYIWLIDKIITFGVKRPVTSQELLGEMRGSQITGRDIKRISNQIIKKVLPKLEFIDQMKYFDMTKIDNIEQLAGQLDNVVSQLMDSIKTGDIDSDGNMSQIMYRNMEQKDSLVNTVNITSTQFGELSTSENVGLKKEYMKYVDDSSGSLKLKLDSFKRDATSDSISKLKEIISSIENSFGYVTYINWSTRVIDQINNLCGTKQSGLSLDYIGKCKQSLSYLYKKIERCSDIRLIQGNIKLNLREELKPTLDIIQKILNFLTINTQLIEIALKSEKSCKILEDQLLDTMVDYFIKKKRLELVEDEGK